MNRKPVKPLISANKVRNPDRIGLEDFSPLAVKTPLISFRPYQREIFDDDTSGVVIAHWSRQIGKSYVLAAWAVKRLLTRPGRLVTVLSNSRDNPRR